jgi:hypothetical protein
MEAPQQTTPWFAIRHASLFPIVFWTFAASSGVPYVAYGATGTFATCEEASA